jgi:hypothetical protein
LFAATRADLLSEAGDAVLSPARLACLKSGAFATTGAGALLAAGADVIASCAGVPADADVASLYSHAEPIVGARPNKASAVPIKILFMDHLLSQWTERAICAHPGPVSTATVAVRYVAEVAAAQLPGAGGLGSNE